MILNSQVQSPSSRKRKHHRVQSQPHLLPLLGKKSNFQPLSFLLPQSQKKLADEESFEKIDQRKISIGSPHMMVGESALNSIIDSNFRTTILSNEETNFFNQRQTTQSQKELNNNKRIQLLKNRFNIQRFIVSPANKNRTIKYHKFVAQGDLKNKTDMASVGNNFQEKASALPKRRLSQFEINYRALQIKNPIKLLKKKPSESSMLQKKFPAQQQQEINDLLTIKKFNSDQLGDDFNDERFKKILSQNINSISNFKMILPNPLMDMNDFKFDIFKKQPTSTSSSKSLLSIDNNIKKSMVMTSNHRVQTFLKGITVNVYDFFDQKPQQIEISLRNSCKLFLFSEVNIAECIFDSLVDTDEQLSLNEETLVKSAYDKYQIEETREEFQNIYGRYVFSKERQLFLKIEMPRIEMSELRQNKSIYYYLSLKEVITLIQNNFKDWEMLVQIKQQVETYFNQLDHLQKEYQNIKLFKVKRDMISQVNSQSSKSELLKKIAKKSYLIVKRNTTTFIYNNFRYQLNDQTGDQLSILKVPIMYIEEMLKYQRFQGNLTEKVGQELTLAFDQSKGIFNINCNFEQVQTEVIGDAFFQSISINPYFSKDSCFIQFGPNSCFHLLMKPSTVKYSGEFIELKYDQVYNLSKDNFENWEHQVSKFKTN